MRIIQIIVIITAFVSTSQAHLGFTLDQCTEKYGKPRVVKKATGTGYIFVSDPYAILVILGEDGKAKIVNYTFGSQDSKTSAETQKMHMEAIVNLYPEFVWNKIMEAERQGIDARYAKKFDGSRVFISSDSTSIIVHGSEPKAP